MMKVVLAAVAALMLATRGNADLIPAAASVTAITRHNSGDLFTVHGMSDGQCSMDTCVGVSSGTAGLAPGSPGTGDSSTCTCRCLDHLPAFRDDLHICVDDIHECALAPFVSSSTSQQIPFVFLPLKGQIVHPSKEISFAGVQTPVCAISGAQFLTESGWIDLRSPIDADVPFKLFRDEGRTFLQWLGDSELRNRMSGRLILVQMLCKDLAKDPTGTDLRSIFTPCVAFRVAGTPIKHISNVSEVVFSPDAHASGVITSNGLTVSEYIAIGICSILLGLIYVASVFLYLHLRRRRKKGADCKDIERRDQQNMSPEEGVIKNNPLLGLGRHFSGPENSYSDSNSSDNDLTPDILQHHEDGRKKSNLTSAVIHPLNDNFSLGDQTSHQDTSSIERLPEENVSIVETLEGREDRSPETVRQIFNATARRKLYFNPSYFEPHLLLAPPPAAIEFLTKIREVISIAKHKMATKRFTPSLMGIPEEDHIIEPSYDFSIGASSRRSSIISLKRENSRRKSCTGCPGCEPQDLKSLCGKLPEFPHIAACQTCSNASVSESKQQSIRKWLEDVPMLKPNDTENELNEPTSPMMKSLQSLSMPEELKSPKRVRSPARSQCSTKSREDISKRTKSPEFFEKRKTPSVCGSDRSDSKSKSLERAVSPSNRSRSSKSKAPLPPGKGHNARIISSLKKREDKLKPTLSNQYDVIRNIKPISPKKALPPPDMINEAMEIDKAEEEIPQITKEKMSAVINEFATQRGIENEPKNEQTPKKNEYETDSLEKSKNNGYSTPSEYAEVSSSQPSPSLSSALPLEEVLTMRNEIFNINTGNKTISKISTNNNTHHDDDHDYELIVLSKNKPPEEKKGFQLPELLHRSNGYSLVSEVYVNNGYNYGSGASSRSNSNSSTLEKPKPKIRYDQPDEKPGHLTIEVEDCPDNYIRVDDSDNFEPDTLDRKPSKMKFGNHMDETTSINEYIDSLERPGKIMLKTTGSFKSGTINCLPSINQILNSNFTRNFGSLREIYEAKTKNFLRPSLDNLNFIEEDINFMNNKNIMSWKNKYSDSDSVSEEGKLLTLDERQKRRQRKSPSATIKQIPPDVIPPSVESSPIYEHPKPPRKVNLDDVFKPPLPPKSRGNNSLKLNENKDSTSSPLSSMSLDLPSSGGSVHSQNSSDFEQYQQKFDDNDIIHESKNDSILKEFIHTDDVVFKNGINNQFILQATITTNHSPFVKNPFILSPKSTFKNIHPSEEDHPYKDLDKHLRDKTKNDSIKKTWRKLVDISSNDYRQKPEDSGYLSTDSNESRKKKEADKESETDESLGDGHSESGAESIETHSVFFNCYRKFSNVGSSVDSGVGQLLEEVGSDHEDTVSTKSVAKTPV